MTDAKQALVEADGDFDKALEAMRKKGLTKAEKRGDRETREGLVDAYIHDGRLGAIVEVNCETSFVAKTDEFKTLAHQIAMQVASMAPLYVSEDDIPEEAREAKIKELVLQLEKEEIECQTFKDAFNDDGTDDTISDLVELVVQEFRKIFTEEDKQMLNDYREECLGKIVDSF